MVDMPDVGGISPRERKMYEQEYKQGTVLFQKALEHAGKAENPYQTEEFQKVMEKAMRVLNQTALGLKRLDLFKQNKKIEDDYKEYKEHPDKATTAQLNRDLNDARKTVEGPF